VSGWSSSFSRSWFELAEWRHFNSKLARNEQQGRRKLPSAEFVFRVDTSPDHPLLAELDTATVNLLLLASDLSAGDSAEQLALLATALSRDRFAVVVCVCGRASGTIAERLRAAGIVVLSQPIRHLLDFSGIRRLRQAVQETNPTLIHAWGAVAARLSRGLVSSRGDGNWPRLVVSDALETGGGFGGWLAARRVRRADRVIATGWAQGERYRQLGVRGERLTRIAPGVAIPNDPPDRAAFCHDIDAPTTARLIFAGGRLDSAHGIKDAVTAFDMMRYESPDLQLVLTGEGPDRAVAEQLGRALAFDDFRIRFSGERIDLPAATHLAEMVWVTCERGGEYLALRAMAAGKPVIAYHTPELGEIIDDGVTGYLVPPGDRAAIATKSHILFAYPDTATRMGEAARIRAEGRFGVARLAEQHARVYAELA
jgi:glycosyltransferase involved in cell wall biosynthesis